MANVRMCKRSRARFSSILFENSDPIARDLNAWENLTKVKSSESYLFLYSFDFRRA